MTYGILDDLFLRMLHYEAGCRGGGNAVGLSDAHKGAVMAFEDSDRRFGHRLVRGMGAQVDDWLVWQMLQDIERGDGVLCFDPLGKYTETLVANCRAQQFSRVKWLNLAETERLICLNPLSGLHSSTEAEFYEIRDALFQYLSPLTPDHAYCVDYSLRILAHSHTPYEEPTLASFLYFLGVEDFRRYALAHMSSHLYQTPPTERVFQGCFKHVLTKLTPILSSDFWGGSLLAPMNSRLESHKTYKSIRYPQPLGWRNSIILVSGFDPYSPDIAKQIWQFAFFQMLKRNLLAGKKTTPFHAYVFDAHSFDHPCLDHLALSGRSQRFSLTLAPEAYGQTDINSRHRAMHTIDFRHDYAPNKSVDYRATNDPNQFSHTCHDSKTDKPQTHFLRSFAYDLRGLTEQRYNRNLIDILHRFSRMKYARKPQNIWKIILIQLGLHNTYANDPKAHDEAASYGKWMSDYLGTIGKVVVQPKCLKGSEFLQNCVFSGKPQNIRQG